MKTKIFYSMILVLGLTFAGSNFSDVYAQTPKKTETKAPAVKYTCPMHPEVISDKPGNCPKCGMQLVVKKEVKKEKYTCPMHPEVLMDKPGKCPKCGMTLVVKKEVKEEQSVTKKDTTKMEQTTEMQGMDM